MSGVIFGAFDRFDIGADSKPDPRGQGKRISRGPVDKTPALRLNAVRQSDGGFLPAAATCEADIANCTAQRRLQ